jgi:hypothetical protein
MARAAADFVQAQVARDGEEPGGKFGGAFVAGAGFVNLQKNILRQVLGLDFVAQRAEDEIHHGLLVFFDQFGKGRAVAALHAQHQRGIGSGCLASRAKSNNRRATRFR